MRHIEIHYLETARDAELLQHAGLPRYDLEPTRCGSCNARVGEVNGTDGTVFWRALGVVLDGETVTVACARCLRPVDKALQAR